jgi:geranylgeranyl reductase
MERSFEYAVAGAGPAGAAAALFLARRGRAVALFDWSPRAEKPCGGGVPARGMARFGALLEGVPRNEVTSVRVVGPLGDEATVPLEHPLSIFARREMDEELRRRAERAGALRIRARVTSLERTGGGFGLLARDGDGAAPRRVRASFLVAADGAAGLVRRRLLELAGARVPGANHFARSYTTYPALAATGGRREVLEIAWVRGANGYGWTFPRLDHASIGWCVQGAGGGAQELRFTLERLVRRGALSGLAGARGVGALIPSFRADACARTPVEGDRFALVGDAAGAVDPITREGIHHALATGAAVGELDPLASPGRYAAWHAAKLRPELERAAELAPTFFSARFLTTMVRSLARSEALRDVFRDLVAGTQGYATLRRRLLAALPRSIPALVRAALRGAAGR